MAFSTADDKAINEVRKLRERLRTSGRTWHKRLSFYRKNRDRTNTELEILGLSLPEKLRTQWNPYQPADVDEEIENLKAILASNEPDLEVVLRQRGQALQDGAQKLEDALTAF